MTFLYWKQTIQKGKPISVPKIRTLTDHPQDMGLNSNAKANHEGLYISDFHRLLRKYWLDEIPQIYLFVKGDLKLIGIRPKEIGNLDSYTPNHQDRLKQEVKYGLIGIPCCVKRERDLSNKEALERLYLRKYQKSPIKTDLEFLLGFFRNLSKGNFSE